MSATVCPRHGNVMVPDGCWECSMEADVAARDQQEVEDVARFKLERDLANDRLAEGSR